MFLGGVFGKLSMRRRERGAWGFGSMMDVWTCHAKKVLE
jgi:hypothetical protein